MKGLVSYASRLPLYQRRRNSLSNSLLKWRSLNRNEGCGDEGESKLNHGDNKKKQWQNEILQAPGLKERKKTKREVGQKETNRGSLTFILYIRTGNNG
jgi:hypothetical protein